jgi:hypothetical protein
MGKKRLTAGGLSSHGGTIGADAHVTRPAAGADAPG